MSKRAFPKVVYIKWDGDAEPYLVAETALKALSEAEPIRIGVYRLEEEIDLRSVEEMRRKGSKRWFR